MNPKVYIETTVVSYQTGRFSRDMVIAGHQQSTRSFWELLGPVLDPFVSALVRIRKTVEAHGYVCPEIVSPEAFLGEET